MLDIKKEEYLEIRSWTYGNIPLTDLKKWVDDCIAKGKENVRLEIGWWPYNNIDEIDLVAYKPQQGDNLGDKIILSGYKELQRNKHLYDSSPNENDYDWRK